VLDIAVMSDYQGELPPPESKAQVLIERATIYGVNIGGAEECKVCPAGLINTGTQSYCEFCPPGYEANPDQTSCMLC